MSEPQNLLIICPVVTFPNKLPNLIKTLLVGAILIFLSSGLFYICETLNPRYSLSLCSSGASSLHMALKPWPMKHTEYLNQTFSKMWWQVSWKITEEEQKALLPWEMILKNNYLQYHSQKKG